MTRKRRWVMLAVLVTVLASLWIGASAVFAERQQEWIPISYYWFDECEDEWVLISGRIHAVSDTWYDSNGGLHFMYHTNMGNTKGVGLDSGAKYQLKGRLNASWLMREPYPYHVTWRDGGHAIRQGSGSTYYWSTEAVVRINANGETKVELNDWETGCRE